MKMTSLEEDLTISKEDNLAGQDTHRKTTSQEVSLTGRPHKKTVSQENNHTGRQHHWMMALTKGNNDKK